MNTMVEIGGNVGRTKIQYDLTNIIIVYLESCN